MQMHMPFHQFVYLLNVGQMAAGEDSLEYDPILLTVRSRVQPRSSEAWNSADGFKLLIPGILRSALPAILALTRLSIIFDPAHFSGASS